ncbi:MAG: hypothetical protein CVU03_02040 [Bacteroidetes bacterium HGW-Bacteroidetes-2]|jgi:replicative DNA helicase|nr:MAG: hypothetical protein CVU13_06275 [Bacteroidetes bacterium HGW-Bacteroidetes-8]PKP26677.1 MAG: hypothetical protein CVU03_02040 [Bacteroidetes bacterium HGW-Bacteroidetes-2]
MKTLSKPLFGAEHLNNCLENIAEARLIFIGGRPGSMKLNFLHNLLQRHIEHVRNVPVFLTGTSKDYLIKKWEALGMEMDQNAVYFKNNKAPVFFLDEINGWDLEKVCNQTRNLHHLFKFPFVIIDNFENIRNDDCFILHDKKEDTLERLRCLSQELQIPILILSELKPSIEKRKGHKKRPRLIDIYTDRFICMLDYIVLFYRPEYFQIEKWEDGTSTANQLELNFAKTPTGISFRKVLQFHFNERKSLVFSEIHSE